MAWQERLAAWLKGQREKPRAASLAVLLGTAAMLLILCSELWPAAPRQASSQQDAATPDAEAYQARLETRLAELIGQMEGAGRTTVMITLESGEERIYALDTQTGSGQSQQTHVLLEDGSALEETTYLPTVCGVAVLCEGGGNVGVEARITALVSALLDVPANRICVEQRQS